MWHGGTVLHFAPIEDILSGTKGRLTIERNHRFTPVNMRILDKGEIRCLAVELKYLSCWALK
jgi:hypothetical protein